MRSIVAAIVFAVLCKPCFAQSGFAFDELQFKGPFATRAHDPNLYCLLGNGFFKTIRADDDAAIVAAWRTAHPAAGVVPVSIMGEGSPMRIVYVWIVDGDDNLNLRLVRQGAFPASVMLDAVQFDQLLHRTAPSARRKAMEAGYADGLKRQGKTAPPETPPRRLVPDARYQTFLTALVAEETAARREKNGIWSDKFKDLREEEDTTALGEVPAAVLGLDGG